MTVISRAPLLTEDSISMWAPESLRSCTIVAPALPMSAPAWRLGHMRVSFTFPGPSGADEGLGATSRDSTGNGLPSGPWG